MNDNLVHVGMDECGYARSPQKLFTHGVATCVAVAFINTTTKTAGLLHNSGIQHDERELENLLKRAGDSATDKIKIFAAGGNANDLESAESVLQARQFVVDTISHLQPSADVKYNWIAEYESCSVMVDIDQEQVIISSEELATED